MASQAGPDDLDELTLARAQRGDAAACRDLVLRYQRPVFALLSRLLWRSGREGMTEDLAQETFLRAFRALPTFERNGPAKLSTWLLTIGTRLALDELRKKPLLPPPLPESRDRADASVLRAALAKAIDELPAEYRAAFLLREAHGFSTAEVARALRIEEGTVKSRLSRAKEALRKSLGGEDV